MSAARPKANRSGFTLVELLVVITIIGILAGLLTVGLYAAFGKSKDFILTNEVTQVASSLESFKQKYGCYPPDMTDFSNPLLSNAQLTSFNAFINKAYPRANRQAIADFRAWVLTELNTTIDPAEALVLFLTLTSKDPIYPFGRAATPGDASTFVKPADDTLQSFHEFPAGTLLDPEQDGFPHFSQKYAKGMPLVYFDARSYTSTSLPTPFYPVSGNTVTPYKEVFKVSQTVKDYRFFNLRTFQLICAGQDGEFGVPDPALPQVFSVVLAKQTDYPLTNRNLFPTELDREQPIPALGNEAPFIRDADNIANFTNQTFHAFLVQ